MDGILRENAQTSLDEPVQIQKIACPIAHAVVIAPVFSSSIPLREADSRYMGRVLEGLAVSIGDKVRATFLGSRYQEFSVVETDPRGPVIIGSLTTIKIKGESVARREKNGNHLCRYRRVAAGNTAYKCAQHD